MYTYTELYIYICIIYIYIYIYICMSFCMRYTSNKTICAYNQWLL